MGYRLGVCELWRITTIRAWLLWYTAGTQHPCIDHHGEGEHQCNLGRYRVCCGRPAAAALPKQIRDNLNSLTFFFWLRRSQATRAPWERELLAGPATRKALAQLPRIPHSVRFLGGAVNSDEGWSLHPAWITRSCRVVQNLRSVLVYLIPWNTAKITSR